MKFVKSSSLLPMFKHFSYNFFEKLCYGFKKEFMHDISPIIKGIFEHSSWMNFIYGP